MSTAAERLSTSRLPASELRSHLRATTRIAGLLGISLAAGAAGLAAAALRRPCPHLARRGEAALTRAWARAAARVVGMRVRIEGTPPAPPRLLVANHLGYVDVIALWTAASGVFVAKSEVASWPLVGMLGRLFQTRFVDRGRKRDLVRVLAEMEGAFAESRSVILFAEGTSSAGERVLPFRSSLFEAAVRARLPVACASLAYETPPGAPPAAHAVCWWGEMTFPDHVYGLLRLPGFTARVRFLATEPTGDDRKALCRRAHELVSAARASGSP